MSFTFVVQTNNPDLQAARAALESQGFVIASVRKTRDLVPSSSKNTPLANFLPSATSNDLRKLAELELVNSGSLQEFSEYEVWRAFLHTKLTSYFGELTNAMRCGGVTFRDDKPPSPNDLHKLEGIDGTARTALFRNGLTVSLLRQITDAELGDLKNIREKRLAAIRDALEQLEA